MLPYSNRFPWDAQSNRLASILAARVQRGDKTVDLTISNPTKAGLSLPDPFSLTTLEAGAYDPSAAGAMRTREAISAYYAQEFASVVAPENILLTTSTSEAYGYCLKMIAEPGSKILLPEPSYPLLRFLVEAEGLVAGTYPLHHAHGQWILDRERLLAACDDFTRAIVIVSPNNPTGQFLSEEDAVWLSEVTGQRMWLICDEVFADYNWRETNFRSLTQLCLENLLCLSGLSKICALPQMKLAWIAMPGLANVRKNLEWIGDTYLSVSSPIEDAAVAWIGRRGEFQLPIRARCKLNLGSLPKLLEGSAWSALPVDAGWTVIVKGPASLDEESLVCSLLEKGVLVQPGFYYDLPLGCSVAVSLLTPPADLEKGLRALRAF